MKFSDMNYTHLDGETVKKEFAELTERLKNAKSYEEARAIFLEKEERAGYVNTMDLLSSIRHSMNRDDEALTNENDYWWNFEPEIDKYEKVWAEAMLDHPFRADFEKEFGDMMFLNAEFGRRSMSDDIAEDKRMETDLIREYDELTDKIGEMTYNGETFDPDEIDDIKECADSESRLAAFMADGAGWREVAAKLDGVFDKLVHLRCGMAEKLGFESYIDLAYCRLHRTFTNEDVARFREAVVKYVVPVADAIKREQAKRIGRPYPMAYSDNEYFFKSGNPHPAGDEEYLMNEGKKFFESLSPEAGEFFRHMADDGMIFAHAGGGNDIYLPYYKTPFLLVDLDGSSDSVRSFMHEAGHTFAYWMNRGRVPAAYVTPSEDITELHSMCMELISLKNAEGFFGKDARKYIYSLLGESIAFITYGAMVDHFQHTVFEHPEMTPEERHAEWNRLEAIYEPWIAFDRDMPYYGEGMLWQQQGHIFWAPFMYIDYVLTGAVALEVWALMQKDEKLAWDRYMALVSLGGSHPFTELLNNAGLSSPFDEECLKFACETAKQWLDDFDLTGIE